ncbi:MAG TPA: nuclear transport factor 2 family protein [Alphaproteobacteria bacterium]|nr:nuclear transport factor 2 family protein [Alphaproteobacteria bacterium]
MWKNDQEEPVLAANEAFYRAFAVRDLAAMERVWASEVAVACVHPGWTPLLGRDAVMESWAGILGNPKAPAIRCLQAQATVYGDIALVLCYELVERGFLVATNLFVRENGAWKLFHHQAGPAAAEAPETTGELAPASKRLH